MKRFIKLFCFIFLICFVSINAKAGEATCTYKGTYGTLDVIYKDAKISYKFNGSTSMYKQGTTKINTTNIMDSNGKLFCPKEIYYSFESIDEMSVLTNFSFEKGSHIFTGNRSNEFIINDSEDTPIEEKDIVCMYNGNSLIINRNKKSVSISLTDGRQVYGSGIPYENLKNYKYDCPDQICLLDLQENNSFSVSINGGGTCYKLGETVNSENPNRPSNSGNDNPNLPPANVPTCGAIKEFTNPIWFWLRIIGPTLALVLGVLDLLKAVASGDDKSVKKSTGDFGMRLALAALLLLLPTVLSLLIGLVGFGNASACL